MNWLSSPVLASYPLTITQPTCGVEHSWSGGGKHRVCFVTFVSSARTTTVSLRTKLFFSRTILSFSSGFSDCCPTAHNDSNTKANFRDQFTDSTLRRLRAKFHDECC